jgi:hypothetical protein
LRWCRHAFESQGLFPTHQMTLKWIIQLSGLHPMDSF